MRQLLLLRHAKSAWDDPGLHDHARTLNARGRANAAAMRGAIQALGLVDESPLIEPMDGLYLATSAQILTILHGVSETVRSVMVVGHNPGLHDLALTLAGAHAMAANSQLTRQLAEGFPAGALAEFTVASHWGDLAQGGGRLVRFLSPRDLPEFDQKELTS